MNVVRKYFSNLSCKQLKQFSQLSSLYTYWNKRINVVSKKSVEDLYLQHVLHSLSIAKVIHFVKGTKVLDIGTGGGFPGIPLAILFPDVNFSLNDSIGKKIKVVNNIKEELDLNNINVIHSRAEDIDDKFDFIISRAVTNMKEFKKFTINKFNNTNTNSLDNGILYLKGGDLSEEMKGINHIQFKIPDFFSEKFFINKKIIYVNPSHKNK